MKRTYNTAPAADGIKYHNISELDPNEDLLEILYDAVWRLGRLENCQYHTNLQEG
jgi:hypothetical protein